MKIYGRNAVEEALVKKVNRTTDRYGETYSSETVQDSNPQIFTWLDLLDLNVWIILALMLCVAGFTMISGLLIIPATTAIPVSGSSAGSIFPYETTSGNKPEK